MGIIRQSLLHRLTETSNDRPDQAVRPFDTDAAGTVAGEGGGLFILEEYERAKKRGAKIYAELVGFAASQDAYSVTEPDPRGHSYSKAIANALKDAKLSPADVDVLVPHGLGIPAFDRSELKGLQTAFGNDLKRVAFAPIKSAVGNLAAGCGADAAAAVLAIHSGRVPGAPNTKKTVDGQSLNVSSDGREIASGVSVSSVYSLGGQNAALVFKRI
jgi:3-oxoacyl-[acyl-carrier-protein] synthase II